MEATTRWNSRFLITSSYNFLSYPHTLHGPIFFSNYHIDSWWRNMTNPLHYLSLPFDLFIQTIIPPHLHSSGCWRDLDSPPQQPGGGASGLHPHAALLLQPKLQGGNSQTMSNICCDGRYFASKDKILSKCYKCIDRHFSVSKNFTISLKFTLYLCLFLSFGSQISNAY